MRKTLGRGRRLTVLAVCVAAAFAATAIVLSVSMAAIGSSATTTKTKPKKAVPPKSASLTKNQVIALIKQYAKPGSGPKGASGPTGPTGATGAKGEAGAKGESGAKGENGAQGEPGVKGETGAKGEAGANGAVAGYSASQAPTGPGEGVIFTTGTSSAPITVLSKSLPAGDYLASGKVAITMVATGVGGEGAVSCELLDIPASGSPAADVAGFFFEHLGAHSVGWGRSWDDITARRRDRHQQRQHADDRVLGRLQLRRKSTWCVLRGSIGGAYPGGADDQQQLIVCSPRAGQALLGAWGETFVEVCSGQQRAQLGQLGGIDLVGVLRGRGSAARGRPRRRPRRRRSSPAGGSRSA